MKVIKVTVSPGGESKIEVVSGFSGKECLRETKNLEEALGKVSQRKMTGGDAKEMEIIDVTKVGS